jgi:hypothetical protein
MSQANVTTSKNHTFVFIVLAIVIVALIIDTSIVKVYRLITPPLSLQWDITAFIAIAIVYAVAQYLLLRQVKSQAKISRPFALNLIHKIVFLTQCALTALLIFVILQMVLNAAYDNIVVLIAIAMSYTLAIIMTGLLSLRFYLWYKSSRNTHIAYGLAAASLSVNAAFTLVYVADGMLSMPPFILPHIGHFTAFSPNSIMLSFGYIVSSIISFMVTWIATIMLLRHHSKKLGVAKYWILVTIPLVYFLSQFQPLFLDLLSDYRSSNLIVFNILYTLIFSLSKPVGGILFGIAFWYMARSMRHTGLSNYLMIAGYGVLLFFTSNQATVLINLPYPPFGMATISFVGLSCYLLFVGIYASAVSVAEDSNLRKSIRNLAKRESKLLDSIGSAQMEQEIQKRVITLSKETERTMIEQTGVESSLSEEDAKEYLHEVLAELKRHRQK